MDIIGYRTRPNIDAQSAIQFAESAQNLVDVMPDGMFSAMFRIEDGVPKCDVHLPSIVDVLLFCGCPKLTEREYDYRYYEYGGISNGIHYFCLIEPKIANELGLKREEED